MKKGFILMQYDRMLANKPHFYMRVFPPDLFVRGFLGTQKWPIVCDMHRIRETNSVRSVWLETKNCDQGFYVGNMRDLGSDIGHGDVTKIGT